MEVGHFLTLDIYYMVAEKPESIEWSQRRLVRSPSSLFSLRLYFLIRVFHGAEQCRSVAKSNNTLALPFDSKSWRDTSPGDGHACIRKLSVLDEVSQLVCTRAIFILISGSQSFSRNPKSRHHRTKQGRCIEEDGYLKNVRARRTTQ